MTDEEQRAYNLLRHDLPSDEQTLREYFGPSNGPEGVYLEPAIAGWPSSNGITSEALLSEGSAFDDFDVTQLERVKYRLIRLGGTATSSTPKVAEQRETNLEAEEDLES
jgi:hypothetical protein